MPSEEQRQPGVCELIAIDSDLVVPSVLRIEAEVCTIGRSSSCQVVVRHELVSRLHARIERQGPRCVLADAGSANGTYINQRRLDAAAVLRNGDAIGLGSPDPLLRFLDPDATMVGHTLLSYDERLFRFTLSGKLIELSPLQFRLLRHLYQHAGDICTRASCAQAIWGREYDQEIDAGALDQAINSLRRAIRRADPQASLIETRRGMGYVLRL
jgi:DNA-binding response OmpR family regulator